MDLRACGLSCCSLDGLYQQIVTMCWFLFYTSSYMFSKLLLSGLNYCLKCYSIVLTQELLGRNLELCCCSSIQHSDANDRLTLFVQLLFFQGGRLLTIIEQESTSTHDVDHGLSNSRVSAEPPMEGNLGILGLHVFSVTNHRRYQI